MLPGALHLDVTGRLKHDDVGVHGGIAVFEVREIEPLVAFDHTHRDSRDQAAERRRPAGLRREPGTGVGQRHTAAGDRRGAGAPIGLEHIAVDPDGVLTERHRDAIAAAVSVRSAAGSPGCAPSGPCARAWVRLIVARGSMAYSAVTHPSPVPLLEPGGRRSRHWRCSGPKSRPCG